MKNKSHSIAVFFSKKKQKIALYSQDVKDLFTYCYKKRKAGQVVEKSYSVHEYNLIKNQVPELRGLSNGEFIILK